MWFHKRQIEPDKALIDQIKRIESRLDWIEQENTNLRNKVLRKIQQAKPEESKEESVIIPQNLAFNQLISPFK